MEAFTKPVFQLKYFSFSFFSSSSPFKKVYVGVHGCGYANDSVRNFRASRAGQQQNQVTSAHRKFHSFSFCAIMMLSVPASRFTNTNIDCTLLISLDVAPSSCMESILSSSWILHALIPSTLSVCASVIRLNTCAHVASLFDAKLFDLIL